MLSGSAFLALWNDIDPAVEAEYNRWHSHEHVPERVTVPGIRSGRRYVACGSTRPRYFTLYDLDDMAVLSSAAYLALVNGPSEWSRRMRPHFRDVLRVACVRTASCGAGLGGYLTVVASPEVPLADVCRREGVVAAHYGRTDTSVAPLPWAAGAPRVPQGLLLAESFDEKPTGYRLVHVVRA